MGHEFDSINSGFESNSAFRKLGHWLCARNLTSCPPPAGKQQFRPGLLGSATLEDSSEGRRGWKEDSGSFRR